MCVTYNIMQCVCKRGICYGRVSVRPSVTLQDCVGTTERIELVLDIETTIGSFYIIITEFDVPKIRLLRCGIPDSELRPFFCFFRTVDCRKCWQLSSVVANLSS